MHEPRAQSVAAQRPADLTGTSVGRFVIEERLGRGGMGEVYRALDTRLRRFAALKRLPPEIPADPRARERLAKEAECVSRLNDAHIAAVYDVLEENGELFVVMEYVPGQTLRERLARPISVAEFLEIAEGCAAGLATAHAAGIWHRDIKPENIMLSESGRVKILDFGLAREFGLGEQGTRDTLGSAAFAGTVPYAAPEILEEKTSDARSDIFSLGVVFYEALAGRNPFRAAGFLATCQRILHEDPLPLRQLNSQISPELERIVFKMLAKNPAQRYSSAADVAVDLQALRQPSRLPAALPATPAKKGVRPRLLIAGVTLLAIAVALALALHRRFAPPPLHEHASILVADFENQTGEPLFEDTVSEAIRQALAQSRLVRIVSRAQTLDAIRRMGRSGSTRVDAALGREICQRENYRVLLAGRIASVRNAYLISAELIDPTQDSPVLLETANLASPAQLYPAVDTLAQKVRQHLGESLAQINQSTQPLARVTTTSLPALQRYSRALDYYAAGNLQSFFPLAKSAVALDPDFAMAHLYLARAYDWAGDGASAQSELENAERSLNKVSERERYVILGSAYQIQGRYEKAAEQFRLLTELYPDDLEGYEGLADVATWAGQPEEAVGAEKRAIALNPHSGNDYLHLIRDLVRLNRFSEALDENRSARNAGVRSPRLHWGAGLAYLGQDDIASAQREFEALGKQGDPYDQSLAELCLARVLMYQGELRQAAESLRAGLVLDEKLHSVTWVPVRRYLLADALWISGQTDQARQEMRRLSAAAENAREADNTSEPEDLWRAGLLAVRLGDIPTAKRLLRLLDHARTKRESAVTEICFANLHAELERSSGNLAAAVELSNRASILAPASAFESYASLARVYASQKDWKRAAAAYQNYLQAKGAVLSDDSPAEWILANFSLGTIWEQAGDLKQARKYYKQFVQLWRQADSDIPAVRLARQKAGSSENHQGPGTDPAADPPSTNN